MRGQRIEVGEHGDVTIRQRESGAYTATVYYRNNRGRLRRIEATADSKTAARRQVLAKAEHAATSTSAGKYTPRTTFAVVAEDWYVQVERLTGAGRRSPSTLELYRHVLDKHVLASVGQLRLAEVTTARLDTFIHDKHRSAGYSTAKLCRSVTSGVCGLAVRHGAIRSNPVRDVSPLEADDSKEVRALTPDECRDWLGILDASKLARRKDLPGLVRFLLGTGCRLGEAVGVCWEDLDLDRRLLRVERTVIRVKGRGLVAKPPKSRSGLRVLHLPGWLVELLRDRAANAAALAGPIFPDARGGYRDRNNIEADLRKVRAGTGFEWVVPHSYRKTVATRLDAAGLSARMIADQLGHSRISMTQDVYLGRKAVDPAAASSLEGITREGSGDGDEDPPALRAVV